MKRSHLWILTGLLLVSCGGDDGAGPVDDGGGNTHPTDPVPTAPGTPNGAPTSATVGAAGGSITSSDGLFTVEIPPGALSFAAGTPALAAETEITVTPITNTAWGGTGSGYRLSPDGQTFGAPVTLIFSLPDSLIAGSDTSVVDVAVQLEDGTWGILKNRSIDWDSRTVTCTTTHFSDYSMHVGVQIRPARALVFVTRTQPLVVRYCDRAPTNDPDLTALLIECDEDNAPLGTFTDWSVNSIAGGNSVIGRVAPTSGQQVTYTAPATEPNPNTVAVSVRARFLNSTVTLVSNLTITGAENWDGQITALYPNGDTATAILTWEFVGQFGTQKFFKPVGPVEYTLGPGDCAFVSLSPDNTVFVGTEGLMTIDYGVDPPSVYMAFGTYWDATHCYQCPDHPVQCGDIQLIPGFYVNDVLIGTNLDLIEALGNLQDDIAYSYRFDKQGPP